MIPRRQEGFFLQKKEDAAELLERLADLGSPGTAVGEVTGKQEKYLILK